MISELFGLEFIEAFACGIPVISSDFPSLRHKIQVGEDGDPIKPGDVDDLKEKFSLMIGLKETERKAMGERGMKKVLKNYT